MNLRNAQDYIVGLDIGTGSVGWAVVDPNGYLYKFKRQNTWGARLFDSAKTAADTRAKRTLRRRYGRRYRRIQTLRELMLPDVAKVDPDFFCRMNQSDLVMGDGDFSEKHPFFNGGELTEIEYYDRFPTIYHLREHLVNSTEKEDIRLVYLALHHMMKYRGNFLVDGEVSAADADPSIAIADLLEELAVLCEARGIDYEKESADLDAMVGALEDASAYRRARQEAFSAALGLSSSEKKLAKAIGEAVFGYQANLGLLFAVEETGDTKFSLDKEDKVEKFEAELLPEEGVGLFTSLQSAHNAYLLAGILSDAHGGTVSSAMRCRCEQHKADLARLKELVRRYYPADANGVNGKYNELFRGSRYADGTYKKDVAKGYTGYILGKVSREDFYDKGLKNLFVGIQLNDADAAYWEDALARMEKGAYLQKLRTSENGAIPHQLHLEEMKAVIKNQSAYYPTLAESGDKICDLLAFRLPYYVGPLGNQANPRRSKPFAWAVRKPGMEKERIYPWNFDEVIDRDACAEEFITNLTGECSYYLGKKVIPKNSLLYSEFCVRQELNVCRHDSDGEKFMRMDNETVQAIFDNIFKARKKVRVADVEEYLKSRFGSHYKIKGTQKESEFASSLGSYCDFSRILERPIESYEDYEMVETLITWVTVFEDKEILRRKVTQTYGPVERGGNGALTNDQVKRVCKLRYTGWSNLSREFLEELRADYNGRRVSIMDILRNSDKMTPMNLMEILADERFGFRKLLDKENEKFLRDQEGYLLEDIPGSPAIKRGINQTLKIIDEIVSITGRPPAKICVEMAREEVGKTKGSRTKSRAKQLEELYAAISKDLSVYEGQAELKRELTREKDKLDSERLYLYFLQRGRCAYSGKKLDIESLALYHVDHIVPQSMVKDDSIDNKVLVLQSENEKKLDQYPLPEDMRRKGYALWASLHDAKLMSDKKFNALTTSRVSDRQAMGFINRQLVETRQITKHVVTLLQSLYPDTVIETVKAELTHNLREQYGFYKVREVNDWHHAHDAFLACQMSRFLATRYPRISEDLDYQSFSRFAMATKGSKRGHSGLIVNSFSMNGFDPDTGEMFRDSWYGEQEIERIRKCLNYHDCFVSHKVEKLTGKFWDETVYSPREQSDNAIPLKKGKSVEHYGHYMSPSAAFYSVIEHTGTVRGKKKRKVSVVGIPVNVSYGIKSDDDLLAYLEGKYEEPRILRAQVLKYQKIEWSGAEYYLTSPVEMINAQQLWLPAKYMKLLHTMASPRRRKDADLEELEATLDELFSYLCELVRERYPKYKVPVFDKLMGEKCKNHYLNLTTQEKYEGVLEFLAALHCNGARGMKKLGLAAETGRMKGFNLGSSISEIAFIDASVTGMFERRIVLEP